MRKINCMIFLCLLIAGCTKHPEAVDPTNVTQLAGINDENTAFDTNSTTSSLRTKALEDTALSLGAQGGLASASEKINVRLEHDKKYLETIYNFNGMILTHGVLPPVLVQGDYTLNLADPSTIRVADKTYKIVQQARFVTAPPNWRDYLWTSYPKPEIPHKFLLPRDKEEGKIWAKAIYTGWKKGEEQAYQIFQQNLARLKRDYNGMILYRKLLEHKMISQPYVSRTELGVTGSGEDMRVNDQVLRITALPQLQTESKGWKAIIVKQ